MPRQNRVTPFGEIIAVPRRGTFMGNRGVLHDAQGRIQRPWQVQRWLLCVLDFRGRQRTVMSPGRYTELFFLDEATGLAAGHRPCFECRRQRFLAFCAAWKRGNRLGGSGRPTAGMIDQQLHAERIGPKRSKRSYRSRLHKLPDGVLVTLEDEDPAAYLVWGDHLLRWSPGGYRQKRRRTNSAEVLVLTPPSTVAALRAGYVPVVHPSAGKAIG
jgi:hypothetical protein